MMHEKEITVVAISVGIITMLVLLLAGYIFNYYLEDKLPVNNDNTNETSSSSSNEEISSTETSDDAYGVNEEYDPTSLKLITVSDYLTLFAKDELNVVFVGRSDCPACVEFLPVVKQVKEEYNLNIYYINTKNIGLIEAEYSELLTKDTYIHDNFGTTPMILISKNDKLVNGFTGLKTSDELVNHFKAYNVIK